MGADSLFSYATLFGFLFALARISGVFAFLPLGGIQSGARSGANRACARDDADAATENGKRLSA